MEVRPNPSLERDLHRQSTWPARRCGPSSASRAKRLPGFGPSAQTLGLTIQLPGATRTSPKQEESSTRSHLYSPTAPSKMNRWNIPGWLEAEVVKRDLACVYCGVEFVAGPVTRGRRPSWEHIINDARIVTRENIARCCISCNASKGAKELVVWLRSKYCLTRGISEDTVSQVIRDALLRSGEPSQSEA